MKPAQQVVEPTGAATPQAGSALPPGEAAAHEIRQYHPQRLLIVALDIGKDVHHLYIRTGAYEEYDRVSLCNRTGIHMLHFFNSG